MIYYIYHIEGVKIGCSNNPKRRVKEQGYSTYSILEQHSDETIASIRERELQNEYGYRVDDCDYSNIINAQRIGSKIGNSQKYRKIAAKSQSKTIIENKLFKGDNNPNCKLSQNKVNLIRNIWKLPIKHNKAELGRIFGVSDSTIRYIIQNKIWV